MSSFGPVRRIITSHAPASSSSHDTEIIIHDSPVDLTSIRTPEKPDAPAAYAAALWMNESPAVNTYSLDLSTEDAANNVGDRLVIPGGAANVRVTDIEPNAYVDMHRTPSVDYNIIIKGSAILITPDGKGGVKETVANAGDIVIQRGTLHAWRAGPEGVRWITTLISAAPVKDEDGKDLADVDL